MSEPTSSLSFAQMVTRVAQEAGIAYYGSAGTDRALPPIDYADLARCKDVVNSGIRSFIADSPDTGWRWMRRIMSVTFVPEGTGDTVVASDPARYYLSENFGGEVNGPIEYAADTGSGTKIEWCDESVIRSLRATSVSTGTPGLAAIRRLEPTAAGSELTRKYEIIVDPQPNSAYVVEFPYTLMFDKLDMESGIADSATTLTLVDATRLEGDDYFNTWKIEIVSGTGKGSWAYVDNYVGATGTFHVLDWLTAAGAAGGTDPGADSVYVVEPARNLHPAGSRFDQVIMASCLSEAEMIFDDIAVNYVDKYLKKDLPQAYKIDARSAPRKLGNLNHRETRYRTWDDVTYS